MLESLHISTILARIAKLEEVSRALYAFYAEVFEEHEEGARVFSQMKREEESHKNEVLFQKRIVDKNPDRFGRYMVDLSDLEELIGAVDKHISEGIFDIGAAVDFAIALEKSAVEVHYRTWGAKLSPELSRLNRLLKNADDEHIKKLLYLKEDIARSR